LADLEDPKPSRRKHVVHENKSYIENPPPYENQHQTVDPNDVSIGGINKAYQPDSTQL